MFDIAICKPAALKRLDRTAIEYQIAGFVTAQLNQFNAGRTAIKTQQSGLLVVK